MHIIILGEQCPECDEIEKRVRAALAVVGTTAEIEHVYDVREELEVFGVDRVPALVIDGILVTQGEVPDVDGIVRMIEDAEYSA